MPSVTQLLDRASKLTGLRTTGSERVLALQALQDAYNRAVMDSECNLSYATYSFLTSSDTYLLTDVLLEQPTRLYHVTLDVGGTDVPLQQVSFQELLEKKERGLDTGSPMVYSTVGFQSIAFAPNPAVGDTVGVWYVDACPTLVESGAVAGEETTPSKLPANFHWSILLPATVLEMLDKDQRLAESGMWNERYMNGIGRLQEHIGQMGGQANRAWKGF